MANTIKKFSLLETINTFKPTITELTWSKRLKFPLYDFEANIKISNLIGLGRGSSIISKDKAIEIAITEALERIVSKVTNQKNTNGISGHTNVESAKFNAAKELIERHVFLKNYYSDRFIGIRTDLIYRTYWNIYSNTFESFSTDNFLIGEVLFQNKKLYVVMNLSRLKASAYSDGYIVGLGCNYDIKLAAISAEIESMRAVAHSATDEVKSICINRFISIDNHSFEDHMLLSLNSNFSNSIKSKFNFLEGSIEFFIDDLIVTELVLPLDLPETNLYFAKASSNMCLDLFVGMPNDKFISKFKTLFPTFYSERNFSLPHILG